MPIRPPFFRSQELFTDLDRPRNRYAALFIIKRISKKNENTYLRLLNGFENAGDELNIGSHESRNQGKTPKQTFWVLSRTGQNKIDA